MKERSILMTMILICYNKKQQFNWCTLQHASLCRQQVWGVGDCASMQRTVNIVSALAKSSRSGTLTVNTFLSLLVNEASTAIATANLKKTTINQWQCQF